MFYKKNTNIIISKNTNNLSFKSEYITIYYHQGGALQPSGWCIATGAFKQRGILTVFPSNTETSQSKLGHLRDAVPNVESQVLPSLSCKVVVLS